MLQQLRASPAWLKQGFKFGVVGVLNTLLDAGVYLLLTRFVGFFATRQAWAKAISYTVGVVNSFFWNRNWTFRSRTQAWRTFLPFVVTNLAGIVINSGIMELALNRLRLPEAVAFLLATAVTMGWNFVVSKFLVFRK